MGTELTQAQQEIIAQLKTGFTPTTQEIKDLEKTLSTFQQTAQEITTENYFFNGIYCRKCLVPAGVLIVGKSHKTEHFFVLAGGTMVVWSENVEAVLAPGQIVQAMPGAKVGYAVTDCIVLNFFRTDKTDVEAATEELVEESPFSAYDAYNKLKRSTSLAIGV